ncbi:hypothetical protein BDQ17DRAFT_1544924 [Cyathus striatus]|nr:hypothetical protein BDQ17DRAFT_1544924 [Cyathus striatus]
MFFKHSALSSSTLSSSAFSSSALSSFSLFSPATSFSHPPLPSLYLGENAPRSKEQSHDCSTSQEYISMRPLWNGVRAQARFKANQQGGLDTHINTHTGAKPFKCNFCVDAFGDRGSRSRHMRKKHANDYTPAPRRPRTIAKKMVEIPLHFKPYTYTNPTHPNTSHLSLGHHPELDLIGGNFTSSQLSEHYEQVYSTIVADRVTYTSQVLSFGLPDFRMGQASNAFPPSLTVLKNTTPPVLPTRGLSRSVSFERLPTRVEENEGYEESPLPYNPFNQ